MDHSCLVTSNSFLGLLVAQGQSHETDSPEGVKVYKTDTIHVIPLDGMLDSEVLTFPNKTEAYGFVKEVLGYRKTMSIRDSVEYAISNRRLSVFTAHK